jgi:phage-related protein (TIGR01555 family)
MQMNAKVTVEKASMLDGLLNVVSNLGNTTGKRSHSKFVNTRSLSIGSVDPELLSMYQTDWASGKLVDIIPNDMTREWREFSALTHDTKKLLEAEEERLGIQKAYNQCHKWARLMGTGFIVLAVDDGLLPDQPLDISTVKPGQFKHIKVLDRTRVNTAGVIPVMDPLDPRYGMPEYYRFSDSSTRIHHSRLIRLEGVELPYEEFRKNNYFSMSVLDRLYESITNFNTATDSSAEMIYEANVNIHKIRGFRDYLESPGGDERLIKRFSLSKMLKSFTNCVVVDENESVELQSNSFSGLPELIERYGQILAAASDIPSTRFMGRSPGGLSATGESDLRNYADNLKARQVVEYSPGLKIIDELMAKNIGLAEDVDLSFEFSPIFQPTQKEIADIEFVNAQRDAIYLDRGVVDEPVIARELQQEGVYANITDEHIEDLESIGDLDDDDDFGTFANSAQAGGDPAKVRPEDPESSESPSPEES